MRFSVNNLSLQLKEAYSEKNIEETIYGNDYTIESKYYLEINNIYYKLEFINIDKIHLILFEKYCILINERNIYILNESMCHSIDVETYYLGHIFCDKKLFVVFQTEILSIDDKAKINRKYTNFINDFSILNISECTICLDLDDSQMVINLKDEIA